MFNKGIASTSGTAGARHDAHVDESASRQQPVAHTEGEPSRRSTDSRLGGLSARSNAAALRAVVVGGRADDEIDEDNESVTSSLYVGPSSARIDASRLPSMARGATHTPFHGTALEIDYPQAQAGGSWRAVAATLQQAGGRVRGAAASGLAKAKSGATAAAGAVAGGVAAGVEAGSRVVVAGARHTAQAATSAVSGLSVMGVEPQLIGAAAGHLIHQTAAVGVTTFAREMAYEALVAVLRQLPHEALTAMQVTSGVTALGLHRLRQYREQRNPEAAARGFHNLSAAQWEALAPEEKQAKMKEQRSYSDAVTTLATASVVTNVAMSALGPSAGQPLLPAQVLATELKVAAYSVARDAIQASFRMVKPEAETNGGVSGAHMDVSGEFYGKANFVANYAYGAVPAGLGEARTKLAAVFGDKDAQKTLMAHPSPLSTGQALGTIAHSSAVKATINTLLETSDWINLTQQEANEAGTKQRYDPAITGTDYGRLADHTIARTAAINSNISLGNALGLIAAKLQAPPWLNGLLTNGAPAVVAGLGYKAIGGTWQAAGAVRAVEDRRSSTSAAANPNPNPHVTEEGGASNG
jgi:hypothetical protein